MKKTKQIKVLMASAEVAPFAKVGGLADVVGSLPPALKKNNCDVRIIMPLYNEVINKKKYKLKKKYSNLEVPSGKGFQLVNIWESTLPKTKVPVYFIENEKYFSKGGVYFGKGSEKFLFFSYAALYVLPVIDFIPDVVHCHDSHTGLIPDILKTTNLEYLKDINTLYTIHNLNYQGVNELEVLSTGNLTKSSTKILSKDAQNGDINFMVQGILGAGLVNTVSKKYSGEIGTSVYGAGLEKLVKKRKNDLYGIVNGIDMDFFDPVKDKLIKKKFSAKNLAGKQKNKAYLQKLVGLPVDTDKPLVSLVSRLAWQKGLELISESVLSLDCQFVFLGTGQKMYEKMLASLAKKHPEKVSAQIMFDVKLAQQIYASSDIFLMPSRFEPCGLGQMIAMRYGTLPVARATGGLDDTINSKVGFKFEKFRISALKKSLEEALNVYYNKPDKWKEMQINAMNKDFSWNKSAKEYMKLYQKLNR
jgi:starch synthase